MILPGKQIACMISVHITSNIYRLSPRGGRGIPRYCFFRVWIELLPDILVARMEELLVNIRDLGIKDSCIFDTRTRNKLLLNSLLLVVIDFVIRR